MIRIIWFFLAFFAYIVPCYAPPVGFAIAAFASTAIGGIVVNALVGIALSVGVSLLKGMLTKKTSTQASKDPGTSLDLKVGGDNALFFPLGACATGGVRAYSGTWANPAGTPNEFAVDIIAVSSLPLPGVSLPTAIWFNDQKITILTNETKQVQGWPVQEYRQGLKDFAWIDFHNGTQTGDDSYLMNKFGTRVDYPWQSGMIGRGIAYVTFTARYDRNGLWSNGLPALTVEIPSIPLYDIRQDSTAGGSGSQRWATPSTWTASNNPIVQAYNVARGIYYGSEWVYGGQNWPAFRLPASSWMAAMNAADLVIDGEAQFRSGGIVECDVEPAKTIEELLKASSGLIAETGGVYKVRVGAPGAAVFSFTDDNVVVTKEQGYSPFPGLEDTYNIVRLTYTEPTAKWTNKESPERRDDTLIALDDNRELPTSIDLPWVLSNTQTQRLGKTALYNSRRFRKHTHYLPPEAWALEPLDVVAWSSVHNGYISKLFDMEQIVGGSNFLQGVTIREVDPSDYNWNPSTDKLPYTLVPLVPSFPAPQPMTGWAVLPYVLVDNNGTQRRPSIQVFYAANLTDIRAVHVQVRLTGTTNVIFEGEVPYDVLSSAPSTVLSFPFLPNVSYDVRGILVPFSDRQTTWSDWLSVTTPNVLLTGSDVYLPGVVDQLAVFVDDATKFVREGTRQEILDAQRVARLTTDQGIGDYTSRQSMRRELVSITGGITAAYTELINVYTGPNSAMVNKTETLRAQFGSFSASVTDQITVISSSVSAIAQRVTTVESSFNALSASVTDQITTLTTTTTAIGQRVTTIESTIPNLATASSVSLLSARVDTADGANANAITALSAGTVGGDVSTANFRMTASAGPSGYSSRIALEARAGGSGNYRSASLFIDVPSSTSSPTRIAAVADQFSITNGTDTKTPFIFQGGTLYVNDLVVDWAKIVNANITWANIQSAVINNFVAQTANIGNLVVGTSNLGYGSVTASLTNGGSGNGPGGTGSETDFTTIASWNLNNENPSAVMTQMQTSFNTSSGTTAPRNAYVKLVNVTNGTTARQYQITAPGQGSASYNSPEFLLEPAPGSAGVKNYQIQISRYAFNVSMTVTQQWWKR